MYTSLTKIRRTTPQTTTIIYIIVLSYRDILGPGVGNCNHRFRVFFLLLFDDIWNQNEGDIRTGQLLLSGRVLRVDELREGGAGERVMLAGI